MTPIAFRQPASESDLDHIRTLFTAYGASLSSSKANILIDHFNHEIATLPGPYQPPKGVLFLAQVGLDPAGCIALRPIHPQPEEERACEMKRLWVDPHFRGLRLGRRLAKAAIAWARAAHYDAMYLDTVPTVMRGAHALYLDLGFRPVSRYNDNPVPNLVFLRLDLR